MAQSKYLASGYSATGYSASGYSATGHSPSAHATAGYSGRHRFGQPGLVWCMASLMAVPVKPSRWQRVAAWLGLRRQPHPPAQVVVLATRRHAARLSRAA